MKKKKIREKSFKLSNNKLLIFPSFVSFEIINKEANLDFYQLNIYGKDKFMNDSQTYDEFNNDIDKTKGGRFLRSIKDLR